MPAGLVGRKAVVRWERTVNRTGQTEPRCGAKEGTPWKFMGKEGRSLLWREMERKEQRQTDSQLKGPEQ